MAPLLNISWDMHMHNAPRYYSDLYDRFKGFMQVYQLQTENDEEETWRDLVRETMIMHGT